MVPDAGSFALRDILWEPKKSWRKKKKKLKKKNPKNIDDPWPRGSQPPLPPAKPFLSRTRIFVTWEKWGWPDRQLDPWQKVGAQMIYSKPCIRIRDDFKPRWWALVPDPSPFWGLACGEPKASTYPSSSAQQWFLQPLWVPIQDLDQTSHIPTLSGRLAHILSCPGNSALSPRRAMHGVRLKRRPSWPRNTHISWLSHRIIFWLNYRIFSAIPFCFFFFFSLSLSLSLSLFFSPPLPLSLSLLTLYVYLCH